jgi:hypothetical protein
MPKRTFVKLPGHVVLALLMASCQPAAMMPQLNGATGAATPATTPGSLPVEAGPVPLMPIDSLTDDQLLAEFMTGLEPVSVDIEFPEEAYASLQEELSTAESGFSTAATLSPITGQRLESLNVQIDGQNVSPWRRRFSDPDDAPDKPGTKEKNKVGSEDKSKTIIKTKMTVFEASDDDMERMTTAEDLGYQDAKATLTPGATPGAIPGRFPPRSLANTGKTVTKGGERRDQGGGAMGIAQYHPPGHASLVPPAPVKPRTRPTCGTRRRPRAP